MHRRRSTTFAPRRERIDGEVVRTPTLVSRTLSEITGAEIWLKFENLQFTAAYKERGALNKLLQLTAEERARGVIAASAGNHAQAVAYHAKRLGIPATIVMPEPTPTVKVTQTEGHGATVVLYGENLRRGLCQGARARAGARAMYSSTRSTIRRSSPGQGRSALEMLEDAPDIDTLVVPIGGGGLMSGMCDRGRGVEAGHRADRRRGRALPLDEMRDPGLPHAAGRRHAGRGHRGQGAGRAHLADPQRTRRRYRAGPRARPRARGRTACRHREDRGRRRRRGRARSDARLSGALRGQEGRDVLSGGNIDTHLLANVLLRDLVR